MVGHYICDVCHTYIKGEKAVNHILKTFHTARGYYQVYHTKAHKRCL